MHGYEESGIVRRKGCGTAEAAVRCAALLGILIWSAVGWAQLADAAHHPVAQQASGSEEAGKVYQSAGTKKMAALLEKIYRESDWKSDPNKPAERAVYYHTLLSKGLSFAQEIVVRQEMGAELLRAGESAQAVQAFEDLRRMAAEKKEHLPPAAERSLGEWLAIAYLRLGEQENCQQMHGQKSCIFPLRPEGVHTLPRGARGAVREFTALLEKDGQDAQSRWLLNVAYMQLGRYPQDVPKQWLIPSKLFDSEQAFPEFPDRAMTVGLDITGHAGGRGDGGLRRRRAAGCDGDLVRSPRPDAAVS